MKPRKQQILQALVEDYIATAEPVGSKSLVERYPLRVSAATVRNVMAELEAEGYLVQPHTSAGRIPSDKAYRFYVDGLTADTSAVRPEWKQEVEQAFEEEVTKVSGLVRKASELMTRSTGYTALATSPRLDRSRILQMKMLMIEPGRVLVVLVLAPGVVRDQLIRVPQSFREEELRRLCAAMEAELAGKCVDEVTWITVESVAQGLSLPEPLLNQVLYEAYLAIKQADNLDTYVEGMQNLLQHPEFRDVDRAREVLDLLTKDGILAGYLCEEEPGSGAEDEVSSLTSDEAEVQSPIVLPSQAKEVPFLIRIGQEITLPGLEDCSFVTTTYRLGDRLQGRIGVVGPKRMHYRELMGQIGFFRQIIQKKWKQAEEE